MNKYDDIINLKRPESKFHTRMSLLQRSAQFAPFAALTGYEDSIKETGRITNERIELSNEEKLIINDILNKIKYNTEISITYFVPDDNKSGGEYKTIINRFKRIDQYNKQLILIDNTKIDINEIIQLEGK